MRGYLEIQCDRPIHPAQHILSPGGYAFVTKDGKIVTFDFLESAGYIDPQEAEKISFLLREEDEAYLTCNDDTIPIEVFLKELQNLQDLSDVYVFTGESNEPEIRVSSVQVFDLEVPTALLPEDFHETENINIDVDIDRTFITLAKPVLDRWNQKLM